MSEKLSLFVPGRLCLFGEHSDWAGFQRVINADIVPGSAIVTGIEQGIHAFVEKADSFIMRNTAPELKDSWSDFESTMQIKELKEIAASNNYFAYVAGVASYMSENYHVGGLKITITSMTLPMQSGLSSSAAICVLVTKAFNQIYNLNLSTMGEMLAAFKGEQRTKSRCGRLDQACAFGVDPVHMLFDGEDVDVERLTVKKPLYWVFAHLQAAKDTIRILSDLNKCYPFANNELEQNVHEALGIENQKIVERAIFYMKEGDCEALGNLMTEAQQLFDEKVAPASFKELEAPKLHRFLNDGNIKKLTWGGKGVGSQGDGSVQFLAKGAEEQIKLKEYLCKKGLPAYTLTINPRHRVQKAIIPVAGYGTRLYPATRTIKKEFMPIVDKDGITKPVILILLEQLYESGINEVCLVVGDESDVDMYKDFFTQPLSEEHLRKLPDKMKEYERKILDIGNMLTFRVQKERKGFGHAVYMCRDFCENAPVLLLLGDTIYRSNNSLTCSLQMMEAFERVSQALVAIHEIPLEQVSQYGVLSGTWESKKETLMRVKNFVEKPSKQYSEDFLATKSKKDNKRKYYSVFGQYILTPEVFDAIGSNIEVGRTEGVGGEFGLTEALASCIPTGLTAVVLQGAMFDIGNSEAYKHTAAHF